MITNKVEHLSWDSQFFGYRIAKITLTPDGIGHLDRIFKELGLGKYKLAYFFFPPDAVDLNQRVRKLGGVLVDQKVTYVKQTEQHNVFGHQIEDYVETEINEQLKELVLQAGVFSRFRLDRKFINNEYSRLYIEWLKKSLNKKIARKILIVRSNTRVAGMTTLGEKAGIAEIGLVAVDEDSRGKGIGRDLIRFADNAAFDMGFKMIQVVTQKQNEGACHLYEKCGFQMNSITNVYHFWRD